MRRAVTFIELTFVMVILGVLTGLGFGFIKTNTAYRDGEAILLKLKQARYKAMGYEGKLDEESDKGCVALTSQALSDSKNQAGGYQIKSNIKSDASIICFDSLGRPHDENSTALDTLMRAPLDIFLEYGNENCTVRVFQQSGYAIIACD
jgi:hypothetical protein